MKTVSNNYLTAIKDYGREFQNEVVITDGTHTETYTTCEIEITEPFSEDNALSMGRYFSKELKLKILEPLGTVAYRNCSYTVNSKLKVGNSYESVAMGVFYPSEVKKNDGSIEVTAYDMMSRLQDSYVPTVSAPCSPRAIVNDIATQKGFQVVSNTGLDGSVVRFNQLANPTKYYSGTYLANTYYKGTPVISNTTLTPNTSTGVINVQVPYNDYVYEMDWLVPIYTNDEAITLQAGHKYFFRIKQVKDNTFVMLGAWLTNSDSTKSVYENAIIDVTTTEVFNMYITLFGYGNGSITPQLYDLTDMYGAGNEPTVNEFKAQYPLDFYAYDEGSETRTGVLLDEIYEGSCAEQLSWLAGMEGKNAIFDSDGKLTFRWYQNVGGTVWNDLPIAWQNINGSWDANYDSSMQITRAMQCENGCSLDEGTFTINSITSGLGENVITVGTGKGITFECPYITQALLNTIWTRLDNKTYYTGSVENFGYPMLEVGDIVNVIDKEGNSNAFYLSNNSWKFVGGCHCTSSSVGSPDAEIEFDTTKRFSISSVVSFMQEAKRKFANLINTTTGIFSITEEAGQTTGWTIVDNPTNPQKMLKASLGGIGFSSDGGVTYDEAITGDGIVANSITAGTINGIEYISMFSKTWDGANYNLSDNTRFEGIMDNTITPTEEDYEKYDFFLNRLQETKSVDRDIIMHLNGSLLPEWSSFTTEITYNVSPNDSNIIEVNVDMYGMNGSSKERITNYPATVFSVSCAGISVGAQDVNGDCALKYVPIDFSTAMSGSCLALRKPLVFQRRNLMNGGIVRTGYIEPGYGQGYFSELYVYDISGTGMRQSRVIIGTTQYNNSELSITGSGYATGGFSGGSARAYKENIEPYTGKAVDKINDIDIVSFNLKDDKNKDLKIGFIADDTDEIFATKGHNAIDYNNCIGMLLKAVQELSQEVESLKQQLEEGGNDK